LSAADLLYPDVEIAVAAAVGGVGQEIAFGGHGRLRGEEITFTAGNAKYTGRVSGNTMSGTMTGGSGGAWTATRK